MNTFKPTVPILLLLLLLATALSSCGDEKSPTDRLFDEETARLSGTMPAFLAVQQIDTCTVGDRELALVKVTVKWTPEDAIITPIHLIALTDVVEEDDGYYALVRNMDGPQWGVHVKCSVPVNTTLSAQAVAAIGWRSPRFESMLEAQWISEGRPFLSSDLMYRRLAE